MEFKSRAVQSSHTLPTTRHHYNLEVCAQAQSYGDEHYSVLTHDTRKGIKRE